MDSSSDHREGVADEQPRSPYDRSAGAYDDQEEYRDRSPPRERVLPAAREDDDDDGYNHHSHQPHEHGSSSQHQLKTENPGDEEDNAYGGSTSLLIRRLDFNTSPQRVRKFFEQVGPVKDVYLPLEYETRRPRGFGFVEFERPGDAARAIDELNERELDGRKIYVAVAQHGRKTASVMRTRCSRGGSRRGEPYSAPARYGGRDRYESRSGGYRSSRDRSYSPRRYDDRPTREYSGRYRDSGRSHEYRDEEYAPRPSRRNDRYAEDDRRYDDRHVEDNRRGGDDYYASSSGRDREPIDDHHRD